MKYTRSSYSVQALNNIKLVKDYSKLDMPLSIHRYTQYV